MPQPPTDQENEYFQREELERLRRKRREESSRLATQEKDRLKELHWMQCPKCGLELAEIQYLDVAVDACFGCGGMFLDKGEIEKIRDHQEPGWVDRMLGNLIG